MVKEEGFKSFTRKNGQMLQHNIMNIFGYRKNRGYNE